LAGHLHNPVTEIDQRDAGCPAPCHVQSQGMSDAAGGSGDYRDLSFNLVHIDGAAGQRLKGVNFVCVEVRLLDGFKENGVHEYLLSPFFAFALTFFLRLH
jgi:hypothetical protein